MVSVYHIWRLVRQTCHLEHSFRELSVCSWLLTRKTTLVQSNWGIFLTDFFLLLLLNSRQWRLKLVSVIAKQRNHLPINKICILRFHLHVDTLNEHRHYVSDWVEVLLVVLQLILVLANWRFILRMPAVIVAGITCSHPLDSFQIKFDVFFDFV